MEEALKSLLASLKAIDADCKLNDPQNENVLYLAFVGDTVFDLFTRDYLIRKYILVDKINELHNKNSNFVCAKSQARIIESLIDNKILTDEEVDFYRHARNAHSHSRSKNSSIVDYRKATGFEALLGLFFYKSEGRLIEVLSEVEKLLNESKVNQ